MRIFRLCVLFIISSFCYADLSTHLKRDSGEKPEENQIRNIDSIYLINLDCRPEKISKCLSQFALHKISPYRFSAVDGWELSPEVLTDVGVKFQRGMFGDEWVLWFPPEKRGVFEYDFLGEESYGRTVFFRNMSLGGIGCALSHLSVLQNAYDAGYETIWVMEDDILIQRDPHLLSNLIDKLDGLVGKEGWDILYTDSDLNTKSIYPEEEDFESDLKSDLWFYWRPDLGLKNRKQLAKRTVLNEDFVQIGSRIGAYSMIVRRSGMKKILEFKKKHHLFMPYDHELAIVPNIKLFNSRTNIVTVGAYESDTDFIQNQRKKKDQWNQYKKATLSVLSNVHGWRNPQKAEKVMDFVYETRPLICVEVGAFGGYITYSLAKTLNFLKKGMLYAIDAWDVQVAIEGLEHQTRINWWQQVDMKMMHKYFEELIASHQLKQYCQTFRQRSNQAAEFFADNSIDFIFLDGSESNKGSLEDVLLYYPKIKEGGSIWLNNAANKKQATIFLMKNCDWMKDTSLEPDCVIFKKKANTEKLMK